MPLIRLQRQATAQPQGFAELSVRSIAVIRPGADARPPNLSVVPAPPGLAYNNTSATANVLTGVPASGYPLTVIGVVMARDVSTNNVFTTWGNVSDGHRVQIDVNAGSLRAIQVGSVNAVLSKTVSANSWIVFAYTIRSATDRALAVGGALAGTDSTSVTSSAYDRVGILCGVNNGSPSGAQGIDGAASLLAYLPVGFSNDELASYSANPWQIFRDDLLIGFAAAGGGGSVSLTIADAIHSHAADALVLSSQLSLTVADASHAHLADNLTLQAGALLAVADATHAHALEAPTLTTQQLLAIADALHAQYADNVSLSNAPFLAIQDATHAHVVDAFALSVQTLLAIQGMQHAHAADGVTLSLGQQLLIVQDMLHTHFADLVALGVSGDLLVALERYTLHAAARHFDLSAKKRRTEISA